MNNSQAYSFLEKFAKKAGKAFICLLFTAMLAGLQSFAMPIISMAENTTTTGEPEAGEDVSYTTTNVYLRKNAGTGQEIIKLLYWGTKVNIIGEKIISGNQKWYKVSVDGDTGFVHSNYVATFNQAADPEFAEQIKDFPESYKLPLWIIHAVYPNYVFKPDFIRNFVETDKEADFSKIVDKQSGKKVNLYTEKKSWRAMYRSNYDWEEGTWVSSEGGWTNASREVVSYFMDPRSFLTVEEIYTFAQQSYSEDQTLERLRTVIAGTFLAGKYTPQTGDNHKGDAACKGDYARVIMRAAKISKVSPYVLAATILQEQGREGQTELISGNCTRAGGIYVGYYNFFNFAATGSNIDEVIVNGLAYAKGKGWDDVYKSIVGGAKLYADGYVNAGQDTYYYKDYNVVNGFDEYWHQYATCVYDQVNSGIIMGRAFGEMKDAAMDFRIPVYENMPKTRVKRPPENDKVNNYYFMNLSADGLYPAFGIYTRKYTLTVNKDTTMGYILPEGAAYTGKEEYELAKGENKVSLTVKSQTGYSRSYVITVLAEKKCKLKLVEDFVAFMSGDVNNDGKISALDYVAIKNHIMEKNVITDKRAIEAADVNGDGKISALDYVAIKNMIMAK
ncbi:MAG: dockerin type I domain-containing protein [Lachnospiraceae bacterium]